MNRVALYMILLASIFLPNIPQTILRYPLNILSKSLRQVNKLRQVLIIEEETRDEFFGDYLYVVSSFFFWSLCSEYIRSKSMTLTIEHETNFLP